MKLIIQYIILLILAFSFCFISVGDSRLSLFFYLLLIILSSLLMMKSRKKTCLEKKMISVSSLFLVFFFIVNFQISIDFLVKNPYMNFEFYFYDISKINKLVSLSGSCLVAYNIGCMRDVFNYKQLGNIKSNKIIPEDKVNEKPLLFMCVVFVLLFVLTINKSYINGGHGVIPANPISLSFYGFFQRMYIIYISVIFYNSQSQTTKTRVTKKIVFLMILILPIIVIFLLAHNRIYIIYILLPLILLLTRVYEKNIGFLSFILLLSLIGSLSISFKLYNIESLITNPIDVISSLLYLDGNQGLLSFYPFTGELAYSVYASSVLLKFYELGYFFWGASLFVGLMKIMPGMVGFIMALFGITSTIGFDTASFITKEMNSSYGLGSNCVGDLLINIGFIPSLIFFYLVGRLFMKSDLMVYESKSRASLIWTTVWLSVASYVVFIPRSSFSDFIGAVGFNVIFVFIYKRIKL